MIDIEKLKLDVKQQLKDDDFRFKHVMGVYETALELAKHYNVSKIETAVASLFHDYMKNESYDIQKNYLTPSDIILYQQTPVMYHALSAAEVLKQTYNIVDQHILDAIAYHVWGKPKMTLLGKIIFVSDYCEPNRDFLDTTYIKEMALKDLDQAVLYCMTLTLNEVRKNNQVIHANQLEAYTYYLEEKSGKIK